jgi:hypothetical protein
MPFPTGALTTKCCFHESRPDILEAADNLEWGISLEKAWQILKTCKTMQRAYEGFNIF